MVSQLKSAVPSIQSDFSRLQTVAAVSPLRYHPSSHYSITHIHTYIKIIGRRRVVSLVGTGHPTSGLPRHVISEENIFPK